MTISPLVVMAGAAGASLASQAVQLLGELSFGGLLGEEEPKQEPLATMEPGLKLEAFELPASLMELQRIGQDALLKFQEMLGPKLEELGVSLSEGITLTLDRRGRIHETSGHPRGAEIEALLAGDPELAGKFSEASLYLGRFHEQQDQLRFAQLYAQNPELAMSRFAHLFDGDGNPPSMTLSLSDRGYSTLFQ